VLQNQRATPFDIYEDPMIDPQSNMAEQLANALRHHQNSQIEENKAKKNVEVLRDLVAQLESLSTESGKDA
jgi:hypothetical protein